MLAEMPLGAGDERTIICRALIPQHDKLKVSFYSFICIIYLVLQLRAAKPRPGFAAQAKGLTHARLSHSPISFCFCNRYDSVSL